MRHEPNERDFKLDEAIGPEEGDGEEERVQDETGEILAPFSRRHEPNSHEDELGEMGTLTGERDRDVLAGGWEGTDDATSTAPSDLSRSPKRGLRQASIGAGFGGGLEHALGGVSDINGSPVGESRDWEHDAILPEEGEKP